jgi:hypothetical protein
MVAGSRGAEYGRLMERLYREMLGMEPTWLAGAFADSVEEGRGEGDGGGGTVGRARRGEVDGRSVVEDGVMGLVQGGRLSQNASVIDL